MTVIWTLRALAASPVLSRRPFVGGPVRLPPMKMPGQLGGFAGSEDPEASPQSTWMIMQALVGDTRRAEARRARISPGPSGAVGAVGAVITDVGSGGRLRPSNGTGTVVVIRASATLNRPTGRASAAAGA